MEIRDYNGTGRWSGEQIAKRYAGYAKQFRVETGFDLTPRQTRDGTVLWIYPVMDRIIGAIEVGDLAAVQIGIEFILEDAHFPFSRILKSNTARALRRAPLSPIQEAVIRERIVAMLLKGQVPHEFKQYVRLLRRIGVGDEWPRIVDGVDYSNRYVMRYFHYLERHVAHGIDGPSR